MTVDDVGAVVDDGRGAVVEVVDGVVDDVDVVEVVDVEDVADSLGSSDVVVSAPVAEHAPAASATTAANAMSVRVMAVTTSPSSHAPGVGTSAVRPPSGGKRPTPERRRLP